VDPDGQRQHAQLHLQQQAHGHEGERVKLVDAAAGACSELAPPPDRGVAGPRLCPAACARSPPRCGSRRRRACAGGPQAAGCVRAWRRGRGLARLRLGTGLRRA
jgi:hypothetical protein